MRHREAFACNNTLDPGRAWEIIRPYWADVVSRFGHRGFTQLGRAQVQIDERWHDSCRHYAAMSSDGSLLALAPQIADLEPAQITALLAHEAGHLVDFTQPGVYWFRPAARVPVREGSLVVSVLDVDPRTRGDVLFRFDRMPKQMSKHMRDWSTREADEVERTADAIASVALEEYIGYTGPKGCLVQTLGAGVPRPRGLK